MIWFCCCFVLSLVKCHLCPVDGAHVQSMGGEKRVTHFLSLFNSSSEDWRFSFFLEEAAEAAGAVDTQLLLYQWPNYSPLPWLTLTAYQVIWPNLTRVLNAQIELFCRLLAALGIHSVQAVCWPVKHVLATMSLKRLSSIINLINVYYIW